MTYRIQQCSRLDTACGFENGRTISLAVPTKLVDALQACDQWTSPNIQVLLHLAFNYTCDFL